MATNLDLFHMHLHRQPKVNTKLDLRSPVVNRDNNNNNNNNNNNIIIIIIIIQIIYRMHENEKKRLYSRRVLDIEHGTFTPLVFTTTGGMGNECLRYHS